MRSPQTNAIRRSSGDQRIHDGVSRYPAIESASASYDCAVRGWEPKARCESTVIGVYCLRVRTVAWLPDGECVITGSIDGTVRIWQADW